MRTLLIAGTALAALLGTAPASAGERVVQRGPGVSHGGMPPAGQHRAPRWGSKVDGRWWGGVNAPGGWNAYRRPVRGWAVPVYWNTPRFYVSDWSAYGLARPPYGYNWARYYDDAVLIDSRGSVYDTVGDVDWDRYDRDLNDRVYAGADHAIEDRGRAAAPPPPPPPHHGGYDAGYAQPGYGPGYPPPRPYPPAPMAREGRWVSPDGGTTVVTSGGGYGGGFTTVTVQTAPVVTTTTTEIYEDHVTWSRPAAKRKVWRPRRKVACHCR